MNTYERILFSANMICLKRQRSLPFPSSLYKCARTSWSQKLETPPRSPRTEVAGTLWAIIHYCTSLTACIRASRSQQQSCMLVHLTQAVPGHSYSPCLSQGLWSTSLIYMYVHLFHNQIGLWTEACGTSNKTGMVWGNLGTVLWQWFFIP